MKLRNIDLGDVGIDFKLQKIGQICVNQLVSLQSNGLFDTTMQFYNNCQFKITEIFNEQSEG